jgi:hypothetical protein
MIWPSTEKRNHCPEWNLEPHLEHNYPIRSYHILHKLDILEDCMNYYAEYTNVVNLCPITGMKR